MISALFYLQFHSVKNRTWMRLKRLKKPKYLLGGIVGGLYFYFYFFRFLFGSSAGHRPTFSPGGEELFLFESLGAGLFLIAMLLAWIIPHERAALAFSEAEIAFLFPAPIERRSLIHFKLMRSQMAILFTTLLLTLLIGRQGGHTWIRGVGWWIILSTLNLHLLGSSFGRTLLLDRGITNWMRRSIILGVVVVSAVAILSWARVGVHQIEFSSLTGIESFKAAARKLLESGPLPWLLWPSRLVVRPYFAAGPVAFLKVLWPALIVLGLHYAWVVRSDVRFEEASLEVSRKLAEKMAAVRAGNWQASNRKLTPRRALFVLRPGGLPAVAIFWKNLMSSGQVFTPRLLIIIVAVAIGMGMGLSQGGAHTNVATASAIVSLVMLGWSVLLGPQVVRRDFRRDLPLADVLKSYPLPGWQVALGELLAPAAILTFVQWLLLIITAILLARSPDPKLRDLPMVAGVFSGMLLLPLVDLLTLQIPNAAVLFLPGWFQSGKDAPHGIEATGQRLILLLGQLLVLGVCLAPATAAFLLVFVVSKSILGMGVALVLGALTCAMALAFEAALGFLLLGWLFERLDLSQESPGT
jgi:ABC-2 type transport system permease protein